MKKSSKIILASVLAIGVTGGVFAYGSHHYISSMTIQEKTEMFNNHIGRKLDLNEIQKQNLGLLTDRATDIMQSVRGENHSHQQIIDELINDQPFDQSLLLEEINQKTSLVDNNAPEMVALLAGFVDSLDSDQKAELKSMIGKRRGHRFGHRHEHRFWDHDK